MMAATGGLLDPACPSAMLQHVQPSSLTADEDLVLAGNKAAGVGVAHDSFSVSTLAAQVQPVCAGCMWWARTWQQEMCG